MSTGLSGLPDLDKVREVTLPCYHDFARDLEHPEWVRRSGYVFRGFRTYLGASSIS